jgi:aspartyl protease family protein
MARTLTARVTELRSRSGLLDVLWRTIDEARIDGQRIDFMVDTGASVVALNEKSAARFGFRPSRSDYNATVSTANGTIKAARTRIATPSGRELSLVPTPEP